MQAGKITFADFGPRLRALIVAQLGNEAEAARRTGITPQAINTYVQEGRLPKAEQLYALSKALNVSMEELLTGDKPPGGSAVDAAVWKQKCQEAERRLDGLKTTMLAAVKKF